MVTRIAAALLLACSMAIAPFSSAFAAAAGADTSLAPAAKPVASSSVAATGIKGVPQPGTVITGSNQKAYSRYIPQALSFALDHGFRVEVVASAHLGWSAGFAQATEKYSPQVRLNDKNELVNYVAGMPFPLVTPTDPKAAVKIAYNWHMGPFMPDDFSLAPWTSTAYAPDPRQKDQFVPAEQGTFVCDRFDFLRFAHRTEVAPMPTLGSDPLGVEWKARCHQWQTDVTARPGLGAAGIWVRYLDPTTPDEFWGFNEMTRRVRRDLSLQQPGPECRTCHQPYWAYALPKAEAFTYRLLGTTSVLACLTATSTPAGIAATATGERLTEEPFQMRHAYILEMTPKDPAQHDLSQIVEIDGETYTWLAARFFYQGKLAATAIPLWRTRPSPNGGNRFELAGSFYVPLWGARILRSLVPAHGGFDQRIDAGTLEESDFNPAVLER